MPVGGAAPSRRRPARGRTRRDGLVGNATAWCLAVRSWMMRAHELSCRRPPAGRVINKGGHSPSRAAHDAATPKGTPTRKAGAHAPHPPFPAVGGATHRHASDCVVPTAFPLYDHSPEPPRAAAGPAASTPHPPRRRRRGWLAPPAHVISARPPPTGALDVARRVEAGRAPPGNVGGGRASRARGRGDADRACAENVTTPPTATRG